MPAFKRKKFFVGNWKMHKNLHQARLSWLDFCDFTKSAQQQIDLAIAPHFLALPELSLLRKQCYVKLFAQNVHWSAEGAYTGEVSPSLLVELGIDGSLVGHSERRQLCGENNVTAGRRVGALLNRHLNAVLCIGETLDERRTGQWKNVLRCQLIEAFEAGGILRSYQVIGAINTFPKLTIAYEPVWAIGTGHAATAKDAEDAHRIVRDILEECFGKATAAQLRVLYGGSVKRENISSYIGCENVDGVLVGGASLDAQGFAQICLV